MAHKEILLPKMGESIAEATIIRWLKAEGDDVALDEPIVEIATDKVDSEVPSPYEGKLQKILFAEGDVVAVGAAICEIAAAVESSPIIIETKATQESLIVAEAMKPLADKGPSESISDGTGDRFYSPLVMNIAKTEGISMGQLSNMSGTGKDGRVTKRDILTFINNPSESKAMPLTDTQDKTLISPINAPIKPTVSIPQSAAVSLNQGDEIIEMDRMRKLIADHMVMSKHTSPHVTSFVEADVTNLVQWRENIKLSFQKREGQKITFTPIFIESVVKAIKDFPMINVAVKDNQIIKRRDINIGMAAALPSGNLIVPVIKKADSKNLLGITREVNDLADRARQNKLVPDEIQGGTFTITNVGTFGNVMGTPIINQPQVAILAVGAIKKKPAVIETPYGDLIGIRHMMFLSLSYDHRVVDGMLGGSFVRRVADYLEAWDVNREI